MKSKPQIIDIPSLYNSTLYFISQVSILLIKSLGFWYHVLSNGRSYETSWSARQYQMYWARDCNISASAPKQLKWRIFFILGKFVQFCTAVTSLSELVRWYLSFCCHIKPPFPGKYVHRINRSPKRDTLRENNLLLHNVLYSIIVCTRSSILIKRTMRMNQYNNHVFHIISILYEELEMHVVHSRRGRRRCHLIIFGTQSI